MTGIEKEPGGCATPIGDAMNTDITKEQAERLADMSNDKMPLTIESAIRLLGSMGYDCPALTQQAGVNAEGWRSIESAPKDGTEFLAWVGESWNGRLPFVRTSWRGYWVNEFRNGCQVSNFNPTHWMPMIAPPGTAAPSPQQQQADDKIIAWVRFCSDGCYEGPIMDCDKRMDGARRESGAWTPLIVKRQQQADRSEEVRRMVEIADAERLRLAKRYQLNVDCGTSPMGGNMDWARLEGAVSVVAALHDALSNHSEQVHDMVQGDDELVKALELALEYWRHRQQRYKNRHPVWVEVANEALANYRARKGEQ